MNSRMEVCGNGKGKYRTSTYIIEGERCFAVAERIKNGVLVSEFGERSGVLGQSYSKASDPLAELAKHFSSDYKVSETVGRYEKVEASLPCVKCGTGKVVRELDTDVKDTDGTVPVVPIFICTSCGNKSYSISRKYLEKLVDGNLELFEQEELAERSKDSGIFINTLEEYIIRVFASKKIDRLKEPGMKCYP